MARRRSQLGLREAGVGRAPCATAMPAAHTRHREGGSLRALPRGAGVALLLAGLVLTGCTGPAPGATPTPAPTLPAEITVELVQLRADVAPRQAQVRISNGSDERLSIGDVRIEDPRFDGPATRVVAGRTSTVPAGGSVDVRVQLPAADCAAPSEGEPVVVIELLADSGRVEATASATDPLGFVAPLHARECLKERLADAATLAFTAFRPSPPGEPAALELTVTPSGAAEATVVGVQRTNLLDFAAHTVEGAYPLDLEVTRGSPPVVVELPLTPFRCDPHAVQEDKRGTIFDVRVVVQGAPGEIELFVGDDLRGEILAWVAAWCGFGG